MKRKRGIGPHKDRLRGYNDRYAVMRMYLSRGQYTIKQLCQILNIKEWRAYHWMRLMREDGHDIFSRREKKPGDQKAKVYFFIQ